MLCSLTGTEIRPHYYQMPYAHGVEHGLCPSLVANEAVPDCELTEVYVVFKPSLRKSASSVAVNVLNVGGNFWTTCGISTLV